MNVNWDDDIPNIWENKQMFQIPNHQPVKEIGGVVLVPSAIICPLVVKTGLPFLLLSQKTNHTTSVRMIVSSKHLANPIGKSGNLKGKYFRNI